MEKERPVGWREERRLLKAVDGVTGQIFALMDRLDGTNPKQDAEAIKSVSAAIKEMTAAVCELRKNAELKAGGEAAADENATVVRWEIPEEFTE